jgi:hypothetical protein
MSEPKAKAKPDPLIDEVRAVREAIFDECGRDIDRLCQRLRQIEKENSSRVSAPRKQRSAGPQSAE